MSEPDQADIEWSLTSWEGSRREQLRRARELTLRERLQAVEEMAALSERLRLMRERGKRDASAESDRPQTEPMVVRESGPVRGAPYEGHRLALAGCAPEPLMSYLKALGVFRLVAEQMDADARGFWRDDVFWLLSRLDRYALVDFLLERYEPTPLVAPWGARSGFFPTSSERTARAALDAITSSPDRRLARWRDVRDCVKQLLASLGLDEKARDEEKLNLLLSCRASLPEDLLPWLDVCYVLTGDGRRFPPLLGTGGNEGSGSYVSGFAQQVVDCIIHRQHDDLLYTSLFGTAGRFPRSSQTPGHFSPAAAGGANAGHGFDGRVTTNPWDYLLCLEGTCLWSAGVTRKLATGTRGMASFPFTVHVSGAGATSLAPGDAYKPRQAKREIAEMWLPLWSRPSCLQELRTLLGEGRSTVGSRTTHTGLDFARAVVGLGIDRGLKEFRRTAFLMRNGQSFLAVPLGRWEIRRRDTGDLLSEIDSWLARFRRACRSPVPPRFASALHAIERTVFEYCRYGGPTHFQRILIALGRAERELGRSEGFRTAKRLRPLSDLSPSWAEAADDGSLEFELARALASIHDAEQKVGSIRRNLEPVKLAARRLNGEHAVGWADRDRAVVWNSADLSTNLVDILVRRLMDSASAGGDRLPFAATSFAPLEAVARFLVGETDDRRLAELLWGLILVRRAGDSTGHAQEPKPAVVPRVYALLKLLFLPQPVRINGTEINIRPEPAIANLLTSGRIGEACQIAARRLRASGLVPMPHARGNPGARDHNWNEVEYSGLNGHRLAAALLVPIAPSAIAALRRLVIRGSVASELTGKET